jgi:hypothetical protein
LGHTQSLDAGLPLFVQGDTPSLFGEVASDAPTGASVSLFQNRNDKSNHTNENEDSGPGNSDGDDGDGDDSDEIDVSQYIYCGFGHIVVEIED